MTERPWGGGWGDPLVRVAEKVAQDCERGLVSASDKWSVIRFWN